MAKRTAKEFSRKKVWEIATQYARTLSAYSRDYYSREYGINYSTFYSLLERAVVESIVDEETVRDMAIKAGNNAAGKAGEGARKRSEKHYEYLLLKRNMYMLPKTESIEYSIKYAYSAYDKQRFCEANFIDTKLFDRMLYKAIVESWVSDEVVAKLQAKSLQKDNSEKVLVFWEQLIDFRNGNTKNRS